MAASETRAKGIARHASGLAGDLSDYATCFGISNAVEAILMLVGWVIVPLDNACAFWTHCVRDRRSSFFLPLQRIPGFRQKKQQPSDEPDHHFPSVLGGK